MSKIKLTQTDFIKSYCNNSTITEKKLNEMGMFAIPCECGGPECKGWAMITKGTLKTHIAFSLNLKN